MKAGDEVIVPANTYIASILAVMRAGLRPVLCEPEWDTCNIDPGKVENLISGAHKSGHGGASLWQGVPDG